MRELSVNHDFNKVERVSEWIDPIGHGIIIITKETDPKNELDIFAAKPKHTIEINVDAYDNASDNAHPHAARDKILLTRFGERYEISIAHLYDTLKYISAFEHVNLALDVLHKEGKRLKDIAHKEGVKQMNGGVKVIIQREYNKLENGIEPKGRWVARSKVSNVYLGHHKYRHDLIEHVESIGYHSANIEVIGD